MPIAPQRLGRRAPASLGPPRAAWSSARRRRSSAAAAGAGPAGRRPRWPSRGRLGALAVARPTARERRRSAPTMAPLDPARQRRQQVVGQRCGVAGQRGRVVAGRQSAELASAAMATMLADMAETVAHRARAGQESVWDYPRPPRVDPCAEPGGGRAVADQVLADTTRALRVLETSQPPAFYLPPADVDLDRLEPSATRTWCEWKGEAAYFTVRAGDRTSRRRGLDLSPRRTRASRPSPTTWPSTRPAVDACFVGDEQVDVRRRARSTADGSPPASSGPFKGAPGTLHW